MDTFTIGGITLDAWEMPSEIAIPAAHRYTKQGQIGSNRIFDAMGPDPKPMSWKGLARSADAASRMMSVRAICNGGQETTLSFNQWSFQVLVTEFTFRYMRSNECSYDITVEIVNDPSSGSGAGSAASLDSLVGGDLSQLQGLIS